ncbi:hypothetical protein [Pseudomonas sp. CC120222-01a]|uniref:hypothetical protein n=1 Tax=Pseudomonas sp. CC120222-01a TaxID=1378075 RepID=UPI0014024FCC|nr:hypothetical protein [Pseudomonas sp. CC120222-01a]
MKAQYNTKTITRMPTLTPPHTHHQEWYISHAKPTNHHNHKHQEDPLHYTNLNPGTP